MSSLLVYSLLLSSFSSHLLLDRHTSTALILQHNTKEIVLTSATLSMSHNCSVLLHQCYTWMEFCFERWPLTEQCQCFLLVSRHTASLDTEIEAARLGGQNGIVQRIEVAACKLSTMDSSISILSNLVCLFDKLLCSYALLALLSILFTLYNHLNVRTSKVLTTVLTTSTCCIVHFSVQYGTVERFDRDRTDSVNCPAVRLS